MNRSKILNLRSEFILIESPKPEPNYAYDHADTIMWALSRPGPGSWHPFKESFNSSSEVNLKDGQQRISSLYLFILTHIRYGYDTR